MPYKRREMGPTTSTTRRPVVLLLVIVAIMAAYGVLRYVQTGSSLAPATVELMVIAGDATVKRADAGDTPALKAGERITLQRGDEVHTGNDAKAKLTFAGGATTELGAGTRLTILELQASSLQRALVATLALHEGKTVSRLQHMLFQGSKFTLETTVATIQAHGTVFQCDVLSKSHIYVAVGEGSVTISMGEQTVELQAGQGIDANLGQPLQPMAVSQPPLPDGAAPVVTDASGAAASGASTPTLTESEKTLFPPVLTPTRPGDDMTLYTVQAGDTLSSIARQFGIPWEDIWAANKQALPKPESLRVGQKLHIPKR